MAVCISTGTVLLKQYQYQTEAAGGLAAAGCQCHACSVSLPCCRMRSLRHLCRHGAESCYVFVMKTISHIALPPLVSVQTASNSRIPFTLWFTTRLVCTRVYFLWLWAGPILKASLFTHTAYSIMEPLPLAEPPSNQRCPLSCRNIHLCQASCSVGRGDRSQPCGSSLIQPYDGALLHPAPVMWDSSQAAGYRRRPGGAPPCRALADLVQDTADSHSFDCTAPLLRAWMSPG